MSKFIGIDIAKETFEGAFLSEDGKTSHSGYENNLKGFKNLLSVINADDKVIMEASGPYYLQLAQFLFDKGVSVSVVNPLVIRRFCQMRMMRAKTDRKDAAMIAAYGKQEDPPQWKPDSETVTRLKQLNSATEQLERQITALNNQLEALSRMPVIEKEVKKSLKRALSVFEKEKHKLEKKAEELVKDNYKDTYTSLLSIPGIGPKAATMLISVTDNFSRFSHYKQLISYVGLSPRIFESGTSVKGRARICKMGMGRIRKILYLCSWSAKRFNHHCKILYERLKAKGKPERVIKIAIANKLLRQAFAIGKNLSSFNKNYQPKLVF